MEVLASAAYLYPVCQPRSSSQNGKAQGFSTALHVGDLAPGMMHHGVEKPQRIGHVANRTPCDDKTIHEPETKSKKNGILLHLLHPQTRQHGGLAPPPPAKSILLSADSLWMSRILLNRIV